MVPVFTFPSGTSSVTLLSHVYPQLGPETQLWMGSANKSADLPDHLHQLVLDRVQRLLIHTYWRWHRRLGCPWHNL